jgi:predicted ribosome quality control (RQC) complex YloA/Tae2 family protein
MLAQLRALGPATLQKVWLPSASLAVLQLRVPGRTVLALIDARLVLAALVDERPTSTEATPRSQATLRAALEGATLSALRFETAKGEEASDRNASVRVAFETGAGVRALVAEPRIGALLLLAPAGEDRERIVWAGSGGDPSRRPGSEYREVVPIEPARSEAASEAGGETGGEAGGEIADREVLRDAVAAEEAAGVSARRKELEKRLRAKAQKLRRTLAAIDEDAARAESAAGDRRKGELLVAHAAQVPRGAREARVPDYADLDADGSPREVVLKLDPALSARENAARWFKRSQRYAAALPRIAARRAEVSATLQESLALLERAGEVREAAALRAIEAAAGAPVRQKAPTRGRPQRRLPYRAFTSQSGARVLVGRSARDNDELLRAARGNDLWLHARGVQGSHVIVPDPGEAPDPRTLRDAALLAAHFSGARGSDGAEVAWTRRKHVRKTKGAAPGAVTFTQDRTFRVRLDEALLKALLATEEAAV